MSKDRHIHDAFFKTIFGRPDVAADMVAQVLDPEITTALALDQLEPVTGEFIDDTLRARRADLVFRVPLVDAPGDDRETYANEAYVFVVMEHQSTADRMMPARMLDYIMHVIDGWRARFRARHNRRALQLPVVLPVVVYQGARPWTGPTRLSQLWAVPPDLHPLMSPHLPEFELIIYDLGQLGLDQLAAQPRSPLTAAALLALWFAPRDRDPERFLARWINPLRAMWREQRDREAFDALVYYLYNSSESVTHAAIDQLVAEQDEPALREYLMTEAQRLMQRGEARGAQTTLLKLLRLKFRDVPDAVTTLIGAAGPDQVDRWLERVLTASTIDEVVAD